MPVFGSVLGSMRGARALWILAPLAAPGAPAGLLSGRLGIVPAVVLLAAMTLVAAWGFWRSIPWKALTELAREAPFVEMSLPPEGLFFAGANVYFKLPDADAGWAKARLREAGRLQLRAQRRVWLLGPDEKGRRFLQLPGVLWPHRLKAVPDLPDGAVRQDPVEQRILPPEADEVLLAHRRWIVRGIRSLFGAVVVVLLLLGTGQVVVFLEDPARDSFGILLWLVYSIVLVVLGAGAAKGMLKPLPRGKWTEMVAVPHAPPLIGVSGLSTITCRVQWGNGWWSDVVLSKVDPALAANIWGTHRLWVLGEPFRGATTFAGVPGHAVLGRVRFN